MNVIQFPNLKKLPGPEVMYLTGDTLLRVAKLRKEEMKDSTGEAIRRGELYEVTAKGIKRIE